MGILNALNHWLNFAAPAIMVAGLLPALARLTGNNAVARPSFVIQWATNLAAGLSAMLIGLWYWGRDGKMATYAVMVLVCATAQWLMRNDWRR